MNPTIEELTDRYRNKGVLVDSNLLLLLFIGATDRKIISRFKRTQTFVEEDYDTLLAYLDCFSKRITLPNILTEVSNLAMALTDEYREQFGGAFQRGLTILDEYYEASQEVALNPAMMKYGLTDTAILLHARDRYLLLTDDFKLAGFFNSQKGAAVNFNHIRTVNWKL